MGSQAASFLAIGSACASIGSAVRLDKVAARDPTVFPAWEVLRMATIEGARAVGLGDEVGSLKPYKQAGQLWQ